MPGKCCVPRCNGNYKTGPKMHVFSFPQADEARQAWIRAIPRENLVVSANSRCLDVEEEERVLDSPAENSSSCNSDPGGRPQCGQDFYHQRTCSQKEGLCVHHTVQDQAFPDMRGFMTQSGLPDNPRASRYILKDFVNEKFLYCVAPPGVDQNEYHTFPPPPARTRRLLLTFDRQTQMRRTQAPRVTSAYIPVRNSARLERLPDHHCAVAGDTWPPGSETAPLA
ncbi:uncharacterized protein LOC142804251 isoform X2 [Rhipicephalus microplus]|uniref:uncharacterized protein LOC142804251 isoform X2 n=1 Tax=Rhipicephalus microplus TaxID=6941 RepID=UPI003F6BE90F